MLEGLKKFIIGDDSNFSEQKYSIEDAAAHVERFYNKFKEIVGRNSAYIPESVVDLMRLAQQQNIRIDELEATNSLLIDNYLSFQCMSFFLTTVIFLLFFLGLSIGVSLTSITTVSS